MPLDSNSNVYSIDDGIVAAPQEQYAGGGVHGGVHGDQGATPLVDRLPTVKHNRDDICELVDIVEPYPGNNIHHGRSNQGVHFSVGQSPQASTLSDTVITPFLYTQRVIQEEDLRMGPYGDVQVIGLPRTGMGVVVAV